MRTLFATTVAGVLIAGDAALGSATLVTAGEPTISPPAPGLSLPERTAADERPAVADGRELITRMHERYRETWYRTFRIRQQVTRYREGAPAGQQVWTELISLPGKVRSTVGDPTDGNCELYVDGAFHVFEDGGLARRVKQLHAVLVLGFDVYVQRPERTVEQLEDGGFDLGRLWESTWQGRPVYVVGAADGDLERNQFWVDRERLLVVRLIRVTPTGNRIEVQFDRYERLEGGWIATELLFKRNGTLVIREEYLDYGIEEAVDPAVFDVESVRKELEGGRAP